MTINQPSENRIRARAFEIYLERGCQPGHALDDWLQAEFELTHLPLHVVHLSPLTSKRNLGSSRRRQRGGRATMRLA